MQGNQELSLKFYGLATILHTEQVLVSQIFMEAVAYFLVETSNQLVISLVKQCVGRHRSRVDQSVNDILAGNIKFSSLNNFLTEDIKLLQREVNLELAKAFRNLPGGSNVNGSAVRLGPVKLDITVLEAVVNTIAFVKAADYISSKCLAKIMESSPLGFAGREVLNWLSPGKSKLVSDQRLSEILSGVYDSVEQQISFDLCQKLSGLIYQNLDLALNQIN